MLSSQLLNRLKRELEMLEHDPPPGIVCYPVNDNCTHLEAHIKGPVDSPFENGTFKLDVEIPHRYPFDPPQMRFVTPIYHPNIDEAGRICADILKMPPLGSWKPALNLSTVLMALSGLMSDPNPDDPLEIDIAAEYKDNISLFRQKAQQMTMKYAVNGSSNSQATSSSSASRSQAPEASPSENSQTSSLSLIDHALELKSAIAPVVNSKKLSKMSLSKRKASDNKRSETETSPKVVDTIKKQSLPNTNTVMNSKYFMDKSTNPKAIPSTNTAAISDEPVEENGKVQEGHTAEQAGSSHKELNSNRLRSSPADTTSSSISSPSLSESNSTNSTVVEPSLKDKPSDGSAVGKSQHKISNTPLLSSHADIRDISNIPLSISSQTSTPVCHPDPPVTNSGNCATKKESKLSNITNCVESTTIDLDAPVANKPNKRSLLSLGKNKRQKLYEKKSIVNKIDDK